MDRTPKLSKSLSKCLDHGDSSPDRDLKTFFEMENDDSPVHIASTQEGCDNIDVIWDWNSPQAKQRPKKKQKRLILPQSPKIPLKRHPSNNQIQNFEKFREELQALRDAMAVPDNEESLVLSPLEEATYKDVVNNEEINGVPPLTQDICFGGNDEDLFDDLDDDILLQCTQKLEAELEATGRNDVFLKETNILRNNDGICTDTNRQIFTENCIENIVSSNNVIRDRNLYHLDTKNIKESKKIQHLNSSSYLNNSRMKSSNFMFTDSNQIEKTDYNEKQTLECMAEIKAVTRKDSRQIGKVEFYRTQSFESTVEHSKEVIPQYKLQEIERKRKEAIARLESKRKLEYGESPLKCSPEEIEKKRLQALAKLEAKRQQEVIERKRQEALKRLELSRKKHATVVKSSLSKRW